MSNSRKPQDSPKSCLSLFGKVVTTGIDLYTSTCTPKTLITSDLPFQQQDSEERIAFDNARKDFEQCVQKSSVARTPGK